MFNRSYIVLLTLYFLNIMQRLNFTEKKSGFWKGVLSFCFITAIFSLNAQTSFHRLYPPQKEKSVATISSIQIKDGHYVTLHIEVDSPEDNPTVYGDTLIINSFKGKGDMEWSKYIALGDSFDNVFHAQSSIVEGSNDSIYFSVVAMKGENIVNIIGSLNKNGNAGFLKSTRLNDDFNRLDGNTSLLANYKNSIVNAYTVNTLSKKESYFSLLNYNGDTLWTRSYVVQGANHEHKTLHSINVAKDDFIATGTLNLPGERPYILVIDSLGNPILSKSYIDALSNTSTLTGFDVRRLADSTFVLIGNITDNAGDNTTNGFVIKTDKYGNVSWSKKVAFPSVSFTTLNYCTINRNNDIILGGITPDPSGTDNNYFMIRMTTDGNIVWQKRYVQAVQSENLMGGSMYEDKDWGIVYMATGVNDKGRVCPSFVKTDTDGATGCEKDIMEEIVSNHTFNADTILWSVNEIHNVLSEEETSKQDNYIFEIPVIGLDLKTFCPNEPIDWTFNAAINEIATYEWSDGSTESTLRVFDEGEYSVTVTINDNVCYMLCDTAKLDRYSLPMASIELSLGNFCMNGLQTLTMNYVPGHQSFKSINWSTGESNIPFIEIPTMGTYSVTVVDNCDEIAEAFIEVGSFPKPLTDASIEDYINVDCAYGDLSGSLIASGNSEGLENKYFWNTGFEGEKLIVESTKTLLYEVTVTDQCGNTAIAQKTYEIKGESNLKLDIGVIEDRKCTEGIIGLNAYLGTQSDKILYQWNYQNANTPYIEVKEPGTYAVTITDACQNTQSKSIYVDFKGPLDLKVEADVDYEELCLNGETLLSLSVSPPGSYSYAWSTGETSRNINVSTGNFVVTISDHCDNHFRFPFEIDFDDLKYANIFFPDGTFSPNTQLDTMVINSAMYKNAEQYNRSFGPINLKGQCFNNIKDYELYIFNRWGQEVFVSKDIIEEWDGNFKGEPAPSDAYLWIVKYKHFDVPKEAKGSVTLIRL